MHIVFFQFTPFFGGAPRCLVEFASALNRTVDVSIVDPYGSCAEYVQAIKQAGLDYHVVNPGETLKPVGLKQGGIKGLAGAMRAIPEQYKLRKKVGEIIADLAPTVLCCYDFKSMWFIGTSPKLATIPLVLHLHGWYTPEMIHRYALRLCKKRASIIPVVSYHTKTAMICAGITPKKIRVLQNPIDVEKIREEADRPLSAELPHVDKPVRLVVIGQNVYQKGFHTAIEALPTILNQGHDAVLWLVGADTSNEYGKSLLKQAKAAGVAERVGMLGQRDDVPQILKKSSIFLFPTHTEGHPRAILEAMAMAKPIAACPSGGVADMIFQEMTGLLFDINDSEGLAACVNRFVDNPQEANRMGQLGMEFVQRAFTPTFHTQKSLELFAEAEKTVRKEGSCAF